MSCVNITITRFTKQLKVFVAHIFSSPTITHQCDGLNVMHENKMIVNVTHKPNAQVWVSMVCTVKIENDIEMWWCDSWKALWNNNKRILWKKV